MSKLAVRLDRVRVNQNGRSTSDRRVRNRILVQLLAPEKMNEHPTTTFTFKGRDGADLPSEELEKALTDRIVFKNEVFEQAFDEPIRLAFHLFQDTKRDALGKIFGKFIELAIHGLLDGLRAPRWSSDGLRRHDRAVDTAQETD